MNLFKKNIFSNTFFFTVFIFSIINILGLTFEDFKPTKDKFLIDKGYKLEMRVKKDWIDEMDLIYENLSKNQVLISFGFIVSNDFLTYLRIRNNLYSEDKRIILENLYPQQKLINSWDKSQKISVLLSCRFMNCNRDDLELKNIIVNYKENSLIKSKKIDYFCNPKETVKNKLNNFGLYDCFERVI